jgi:hypothetical protein
VKSRVGARVRAWIALAAFLCTFGLPSIAAGHLSAADDAGCGLSAPSAPGDTEAGVRAGQGTVEAHCPLCHLQRAVGGASTTGLARIAAPEGPTFAFPLSVDHALTVALRLRAARAPPVSL